MSSTFSATRLLGVVRRNPHFRRLYAANAVSQLGDWFNVVALFSLLLELTGSGEAVAISMLARLVPAFFVGPVAGVLADRLPRRALMLAADLARAALVLCLLFVRRPDQVWIAYAVMLGHAMLSAVFEPAQQATFPGLVAPEDLAYAGTLENSLWAATLACGSALGGAVVAAFGRNVAFIVDAASFVSSAALIARLPNLRAAASPELIELREEARDPDAGLVSLLGLADLREGVRYVARHRRVRALLVAKASFGLTLGGVLVLLAIFGERVFGHAGGGGIAILWTARGVGSFVGPFAAFRTAGTDERGLGQSMAGAFVLLIVCYSVFALSPNIWLAAAALACANAGGSILWTSGSTLLQRVVPDGIRGRVAAAELGGMMLAMASSTYATGALLDRGVPPRALMAACGLVAVFPLAFWWRQLRVTAGDAAE